MTSGLFNSASDCVGSDARKRSGWLSDVMSGQSKTCRKATERVRVWARYKLRRVAPVP